MTTTRMARRTADDDAEDGDATASDDVENPTSTADGDDDNGEEVGK